MNSGVQQQHCSSTVHVEFSFVFNLLFDNDAIVIRICTILYIVHIYIYYHNIYREQLPLIRIEVLFRSTCSSSTYYFYCSLPVCVSGGALHSITYIMWQVDSDLWQVCISPKTPVFSNSKTDCHDTSEILLKVVFNTIPPNHWIRSNKTVVSLKLWQFIVRRYIVYHVNTK